MSGFAKMIFLAFVSVAYLMSHATVAHAKMDNLEDLLEAVSQHLDTRELLPSLIPHGFEIVNQLFDAGRFLSKRNNLLDTVLQSLLSLVSDKSHAGAPLLNKAMVQNLLRTTLKSLLDKEMFTKIEFMIDPAVEIVFVVFDVVAKLTNSTTTVAPVTTNASVGPRDLDGRF